MTRVQLRGATAPPAPPAGHVRPTAIVDGACHGRAGAVRQHAHSPSGDLHPPQSAGTAPSLS